MVIVVTAMDTHGSWHINFASFVLGISKADIASETGNLCRVIAVTKSLNSLCLNARYICGANIHTTTQLVVRYTMWAMFEVRNEPFLGLSLLVCLTNWKKGKFGELRDLDLSD